MKNILDKDKVNQNIGYSKVPEIPKHVSPSDKSVKNQFGPEKHWFPPDQLSGIKYWVCCIKEPCLISNLSMIYYSLANEVAKGYTNASVTSFNGF